MGNFTCYYDYLSPIVRITNERKQSIQSNSVKKSNG